MLNSGLQLSPGREDGVRDAETLKNVDNVLFFQLLDGFMGTGF